MQLFLWNTKTSYNKWGFTLVEMLIVIVIIGILAAALIPRLNTARWRANDTARKADLQQVSAVMVSYSIDHGIFPWNDAKAYTLEDIRSDLVSAGISSIPLDPNRSRSFDGVWPNTVGTPGCMTTDPWQYGYVAIKKNWISRWGFVLMAGTETLGWSNTIYQAWYTATNGYTNGCIQYDIIYNNVKLCDSITHDNTTTDITTCTAQKDTDVLRYIYIY